MLMALHFCADFQSAESDCFPLFQGMASQFEKYFRKRIQGDERWLHLQERDLLMDLDITNWILHSYEFSEESDRGVCLFCRQSFAFHRVCRTNPNVPSIWIDRLVVWCLFRAHSLTFFPFCFLLIFSPFSLQLLLFRRSLLNLCSL